MGRRVVWVGLAALLSVGGCGKTENQGGSGSGGPVSASGAGEGAAPDAPVAGAGGSGEGGASMGAGVPSAAGADAGAAGAAPEVVGTFEHSLLQAYCDRLLQCPAWHDDEVGVALLFGSPTRCVEQLALFMERDPSSRDLRAKLADGSISFVPAAVAACLSEMRSCGWSEREQDPRARGPKCRAVYAGSVPVGGDCRRSEECADDARCVGEEKCGGTCVPRQGLGSPCESSQACAEGDGPVVCTLSASSTATTCQKLTRRGAADEEPCTRIAAAGQTEVLECGEGSWCDTPPFSSSGTGVCRARLAAGASCDDALDFCPAGLGCWTGSCQARSVAREPGLPCELDLSGTCDPFARLTCVDNQCQRAGDGAQGSACAVTDTAGLLQCNAGLRCAGGAGIGSLGTCQPLLDAGQPCQRDGDCASGTCDGLCVAYCALER